MNFFQSQWFQTLWSRLKHIVSDFILILAIILSLSIFSYVLHHSNLPSDRTEVIESIHFWVAVMLMLMFSFFTILSLGKDIAVFIIMDNKEIPESYSWQYLLYSIDLKSAICGMSSTTWSSER